VYALRHATHAERRSCKNFIFDEHDAPMPMDYFIWAVRGNEPTIVVDIGYGADAAGRGNGRLLRRPVDALRQVGIDAAEVVLTHLGWDHAGGLDLFPRALFHLQAEPAVAHSSGRLRLAG